MSVGRDILRTYRRPRRVLAERIAMGQREDRALALLFLGCAVMFVAQWPNLARLAWAAPEIPLSARMGGALMGWLFILPLALYVVAAASHVLARLVGGQGTWFGARMAVFWALLASTPAWLLNGLVAGFIGPGPAMTVTGTIALAAFLGFWGAGLWEVERKGRS